MDWQTIGSLARWAPTPHNTQPYRIVPRSADRADLVLLSERLLPKEDHGNFYVASAFGIFAVALERSGLHHGCIVEVTPVPELDVGALTSGSGRVKVGEAHVRGACTPEPQSDLLEARRTSRLPFEDRPVPPSTVTGFQAVCQGYRHRFIASDEASIVGDLVRLNTEAIIDNLQLDEERNEISNWYRYGETPEFGDGLWEKPLAQPAWELKTAFAVPWLFRLPGFKQFAQHRYMQTQRGTRHTGLLCGPFSRWPELFVAGRMLLDLWLAMAKERVYMHPWGSMLTNPAYAKRIAERFQVDDCWLIVRFGYSSEPARSPRLESIVIE
jgi:hypothetical protein